MGGMIRDWGFAAGAIFGNISVMLAWFGINLLGVGLHSYGFTEGIAKNLYLFIAFEVVFVGVFALLERRGCQVSMNKERVKQNEQQ